MRCLVTPPASRPIRASSGGRCRVPLLPYGLTSMRLLSSQLGPIIAETPCMRFIALLTAAPSPARQVKRGEGWCVAWRGGGPVAAQGLAAAASGSRGRWRRGGRQRRQALGSAKASCKQGAPRRTLAELDGRVSASDAALDGLDDTRGGEMLHEWGGNCVKEARMPASSHTRFHLCRTARTACSAAPSQAEL